MCSTPILRIRRKYAIEVITEDFQHSPASGPKSCLYKHASVPPLLLYREDERQLF